MTATVDAEKEWLYALDLSQVDWMRPDGVEGEAVEIALLGNGCVALRSSEDQETVMRYTRDEWKAFVLGVRDGEFDL